MTDLFMVTLLEMKENLGIEDSMDDAVLERWLVGLQSRIEDHCRRKFARVVDQVETLNGGHPFLFLDRWPLESVASVHVSDAQEWDAGSLLDAASVRTDFIRGKMMYGTNPNGSLWPRGFQNIRVQYTGGFVAAGETVEAGQFEMDDSLRRAVMMQGEFEWRNRKVLGVGQMSAQGVSISAKPSVALSLKGKTFMPEVGTTLAPLRRIL